MAKASTPQAPPSLSSGPPSSSSSEPAGASTGSAAPCTSMFLEAARESGDPRAGMGSGSAAALFSASLTVQPARDRALVPAWSRPAAESPGRTAYRNDRVAVPLPPAYVAFRGGSVASSSEGAAAAVAAAAAAAAARAATTGSSNTTVMLTMRPVPYVPSGSGDETRSTEGGTPSISMSFECPSEPGAPGTGRVKKTFVSPVESLMVPPSSASAVGPA